MSLPNIGPDTTEEAAIFSFDDVESINDEEHETGPEARFEQLNQAIRDDDIETIKFMLETNMYIPNMWVIPGKPTLLEVAVMCENLEIVELLLEKGFAAEHSKALKSNRGGTGARSVSSASTMNGKGQGGRESPTPSVSGAHRPHRTANSRASFRKRKGTVTTSVGPQKFASGVVKAKGSSLRSGKSGPNNPLHWASYQGHLPIACALLKAGFDPSATDTEGNTALHLAATACNEKNGRQHKQLLEIFISENVDIGSRNMFGNTPVQLSTCQKARSLLAFIALDPTAKSSVLSLSRIITSEENLRKKITVIWGDLRQEEEQAETKWDIFGEPVPELSTFVPSSLSSSDGTDLSFQEKAEMEQAIQKSIHARTHALKSFCTKNENDLYAFEQAIIAARSSFASKDLVVTSESALAKIKARLFLDQATLGLLNVKTSERGEKINQFIETLRTAKRKSLVTATALKRAVKVYLYVNAQNQLADIYRTLQFLEAMDTTLLQVKQLDYCVKNFGKHRILFGAKRRNFLQREKRLQLMREKKEQEDAEAENEKGKKSKKGKAGKQKKRKTGMKSKENKKAGDTEAVAAAASSMEASSENMRENSSSIDNPQGGPSETVVEKPEDDEDDILIRNAKTLLRRLSVEVSMLQCIDSDTSAQAYKHSAIERITVIERISGQLEKLLASSEELNTTDPGTINEAIVEKALIRAKQLQRELKSAKRQLAEKTKNSKKEQGTQKQKSSPASVAAASRRRNKK